MSFGKQAKIGLGVIAVLMIVFGVVVVQKIMTAGERLNDQPIADASDKVGDDAKPGAPIALPGAHATKPSAAASAATKSGRGDSPGKDRWSNSAADAKPSLRPSAPPTPHESHRSTAGYSPSGSAAGEASASGRSATAGGAEAYDPMNYRQLPPAPDRDDRGTHSLPRASHDATLARESGYGIPSASSASTADRYAPAVPDRYSAVTHGAHSSGIAPAPPPPPSPTPSYPAYGQQYGPTGAAPSAPSPSYGATTAAGSRPSASTGSGYGGYGSHGSRSATVAPAAASRNGRREDGNYDIQPNDSYWTISEKCYGTGSYFKALAELNRKRFPQENDLKVGDTVLTPDVAQLEKSYPHLCPKPSRRETVRSSPQMTSGPRHVGGKTYTTQEGDTLYDIARRELGKASRWDEIYELNRGQLGNDYNYLPPGLTLSLPGNAPSQPDTMTRRPNYPTAPAYQR